jgi:hypothetical protein
VNDLQNCESAKMQVRQLAEGRTERHEIAKAIGDSFGIFKIPNLEE